MTTIFSDKATMRRLMSKHFRKVVGSSSRDDIIHFYVNNIKCNIKYDNNLSLERLKSSYTLMCYNPECVICNEVHISSIRFCGECYNSWCSGCDDKIDNCPFCRYAL